MRTILSLFLICIFVSPSLHARVDLVSFKGIWRYSNGEKVPPPSWKTLDFDDSSWLLGKAPFGYGRYEFTTFVESAMQPRPLTTFFRTSFHLDDPDEWERFQMKFRADDGMVIYLNGEKIAWFNMPNGEITPETPSVHTIQGWVPWATHHFTANDRGKLRKGRNVIAISAHQARRSSSDLEMKFFLTGIEKNIQTTEVANGDSKVKFYDGAEVPPPDWNETRFDDEEWKTGRGLMGYGNPEIESEVDFGEDPQNKNNCVWFRKTFTVTPEMDVRGLLVKARFDDGSIFYLNGREMSRNNLPWGRIDEFTHSLEEHNDWAWKDIAKYAFGLDGLPVGENVFAVRLHLASPQSPDLCLKFNSIELEYLKRDRPRPSAPEPAEDGAELARVNVVKAAEVAQASAAAWAFSEKEYQKIAQKFYEKGELGTAQRALTTSAWARIFSAEGQDLDGDLKFLLLSEKNLWSAQEFLDLWHDDDDHYRVFEILNSIHEKEPEALAQYLNLALAIALVYDQNPPFSWPHHQVEEAVLPRKLPEPVAAFQFWSALNAKGKTLQALDKMMIRELKFVVDTPLSLSQLEDALGVRVRLTNLPDLYEGIEYSHERLRAREYIWPFRDYSLERIRKEGGICVDQAYYTSQVAKAHGVPAMMVSGAGSNGNHAWVGFLDQSEKWDFTTGRYEESRFVTGKTFDPQTWGELTDHELAALTERFQKSSRFRESRLHSAFAHFLFDRGDFEKAAVTAQTAIEAEDRNKQAWDILIKSNLKLKVSAEEMQALYTRGARAFSRSADLEANFLQRLTTSLRSEGKSAEAEKIRSRIIARNRRERPDLALRESWDALDKLIGSDASLDEQMTYYKSQARRMKDAGLIAFYNLTEPFLEHLFHKNETERIKEVIDYTESRMEVEKDSQLWEAFQGWRMKL